MNTKKKINKKEKCNIKKSDISIDSDFPSVPRIEIYKETFGDLENITEKWYKENGE